MEDKQKYQKGSVFIQHLEHLLEKFEFERHQNEEILGLRLYVDKFGNEYKIPEEFFVCADLVKQSVKDEDDVELLHFDDADTEQISAETFLTYKLLQHVDDVLEPQILYYYEMLNELVGGVIDVDKIYNDETCDCEHCHCQDNFMEAPDYVVNITHPELIPPPVDEYMN